MRRRVAVVAVSVAMVFGMTVGVAGADPVGASCNNGVGNGPDCRPGRATFSNDDHGHFLGNPGARGGGAAGTEYVTRNKGDNSIVNE